MNITNWDNTESKLASKTHDIMENETKNKKPHKNPKQANKQPKMNKQPEANPI